MGYIKQRRHVVTSGLCAMALLALPRAALADAGGVSFWLPGTLGSLAATPAVPGWAYETIYIHLQMSAGAGKNFVTTNGIPGSVVAGLNAHADALVEGVTYTSALPVLGGQATAAPARSWVPLKGMAVGLGPQIGFLFPVGDMQGYLNLKAYEDLDVENRPKGWSS
jgi:hypothetical protein